MPSSLVIWFVGGLNTDGQLGDATTINHDAPNPVQDMDSGVTAVATGSQHTCGIKFGGALYFWGNNNWGQLGDGSTTMSLTPVLVSDMGNDVFAVSAGFYHTFAVMSLSTVSCWGKI